MNTESTSAASTSSGTQIVSCSSKCLVTGGTPITEDIAIELRVTIFGTSTCQVRSDWMRTSFIFRQAGDVLSYGLTSAKNSVRSLMASVQAQVIQWLLFDSRSRNDDKANLPPEHYLLPSQERQSESLWQVMSEIIWRCCTSDTTSIVSSVIDHKAYVALPTDNCYVMHSSKYYQDGITEKLQIFEFKSFDNLQYFLKKYIHFFQEPTIPGALLLLYSAVLSRGCLQLKKDLDGKLRYLLSSQAEGSMNIVTLMLTGRATPYLHNGVIYMGDEDHYALPQFGILTRSKVGLLVWYGNEEHGKNTFDNQYPGSRLKTPAFPVWVTFCSGRYGILFNTNRELLRDYHAERRFDLQYYTTGGCHVTISVDTRTFEPGTTNGQKTEDINSSPLEKLLHTKWQDASIAFSGPVPYIGEQIK